MSQNLADLLYYFIKFPSSKATFLADYMVSRNNSQPSAPFAEFYYLLSTTTVVGTLASALLQSVPAVNGYTILHDNQPGTRSSIASITYHNDITERRSSSTYYY